MKKFSILILFSLLLLSCKEASNPVTPTINGIDFREDFKRVWAKYDSLYPLFDYKKIDWQQIYSSNVEKFRQLNSIDERNLLLLDILKVFQDEHIYLYPRGKYILKAWVSPKKSNFNEAVFSLYKKQMNWRQVNNYLGWGTFNNIGYIRIDDLIYFGLDKFDLILDSLSTTNGLIIDIRNNSGGFIGLGAEIVGRFTNKNMDLGYFLFRDGQKHIDYAPLQKINATTIGKSQYIKKIALLLGRRTASASEFFAYSMSLLDNVKLVGDTTKGNVVGPTNDTLKDGTIYKIPQMALLDVNQQPLEDRGAIPDYCIRYDENNLNGKDPIIEYALEYLKVNIAYNTQLKATALNIAVSNKLYSGVANVNCSLNVVK